MTALWMLGAAILIIVLIAKEQIAILYLVATLGLALLLFIVAWSDLGAAQKAPAGELTSYDDSAAIADGITTPTTRPTRRRS